MDHRYTNHSIDNNMQQQQLLPKRMPLSMSRKLTDRIHSSVRDMVSKSRLSRLQPKEALLLVDRNEVVAHELLGSGAFSQVHLVTCSSGSTPQQQYAMKHVKPELLRTTTTTTVSSDYNDYDYGYPSQQQDDNNSFCLAACELAVEAHLLASLDHPNIVAIRGWAANGVASFAQGCRHDSFFLLLDPLVETLDQRLATWKQDRQQQHANASSGATTTTTSPLSSPPISPQRPKQDGFWSRWASTSLHPQQQHLYQDQQELRFQQEYMDDLDLYAIKLRICAEIASALAYLHSLHIIYRDLKPNNIGFLPDGRVQLFDFGLSRELPVGMLTDAFQMSGKVGTLRYMSPEVAMHQPYNVSADVYSFSMVAYEILTLAKPFQGWTRDMHSKLVCGKHLRPDVAPLTLSTTAASRPATSRLIRPLIEASWHAAPHQRPSMRMIYEQLHVIHGDCQRQQELQRHQRQHQQQLYGHASSQQQLLQQVSPPSVSIELPPDFEVVRKPPHRSVSASTKTTVSMSLDGGAYSGGGSGQFVMFG